MVSAVKKNGQTQFIRIKSLTGEPCRVKTNFNGQIKATGISSKFLKDLGNGVVEISLKKGETAILYTDDKLPSLHINAVSLNGPNVAWGGKKPL